MTADDEEIRRETYTHEDNNELLEVISELKALAHQLSMQHLEHTLTLCRIIQEKA